MSHPCVPLPCSVQRSGPQAASRPLQDRGGPAGPCHRSGTQNSGRASLPPHAPSQQPGGAQVTDTLTHVSGNDVHKHTIQGREKVGEPIHSFHI